MSATTTDVHIAILAKAPIPGFAKTRLIPALGAHGAAALQEQLIERTVSTALDSGVGPVTVWVTPDFTHSLFNDLTTRLPIGLACQPQGDLGERMLAAFAATRGMTIVIGTDCPALECRHLKDAAVALRNGDQVVLIPAEDGGYVLIGMHRPELSLFADILWGSDSVAQITRQRARQQNLSLRELDMLWDLDRPGDLVRLRGFKDLHGFF